ncbi:MAG: hypothetical protein HRF43_10130, partial [Phycisphaerae bacterium]|jgi:D-alanyl-lipoteichoic acid acyltransferase DltB (MBOAT superfamily)
VPPNPSRPPVTLPVRLAAVAVPAVVGLQLLLCLLILKNYRFETYAFRLAFLLAAGGWVIHHFLPRAARLPFFVLLSLATMVYLLGIDAGRPSIPVGLLRAGAIVGIGGVLIGICHLPVGFWARAGLLAAAGALIAVGRHRLLGGPEWGVLWPVLAAMFMFRVMIYLYDVSSAKQKPTLAQTLAYFFMVPNVCCLLFPVVDFKTFCRTHEDRPNWSTYQNGLRRITRGLVQLALYRLVASVLFIPPADVRDGSDLAQFVLANSLLYLKVSGLFHVVAGLLLLFGFNLPETNRRYFLASSFTDYWRRVNIYWKDFMLKVFYYPAYFRLKKWGPTGALAGATCFSFFVTWLLHAYQTWWLKGEASFSWPDLLFWSILAGLVLVNVLWEDRLGRQRKLGPGGYTPLEAVVLVVKTALTFACVSVLWSLWSSGSVVEWLRMWRLADGSTAAWGAAAMAVVMIATLLLEVLPGSFGGKPRGPAGPSWRPPARSAAGCTITLLAVLVLAEPAVQGLVPATLQPYLEVMARGSASEGQRGGNDRGYYEQLDSVRVQDRALQEVWLRAAIPPGSDVMVRVNDYRHLVFPPNLRLANYHGADFSTNRWGMRDRDYEQAKPAGTVRIAVLGSSHVMGWGVADRDVFDIRLEERLNAAADRLASGVKFEVLNFASQGWSPLAQLEVVERQVKAFSPDVVVYVGHSNDSVWLIGNLHAGLRKGLPLPRAYLAETLVAAGVTGRTNEVIARGRLRPFESGLLARTYQALADACRAAGALPVGVFLPLPRESARPAEIAGFTRALADAGFVLLDLSDVYQGKDREEYAGPDPGGHSNAKAHALIADVLYDRLTGDPRIDLAGLARKAVERKPPVDAPATRE